jgi:hypothetical protein
VSRKVQPAHRAPYVSAPAKQRDLISAVYGGATENYDTAVAAQRVLPLWGTASEQHEHVRTDT